MRRLSDEIEQRRPEINIVPMIDVTFALLTFFILATLFLSKSEGLPVNLPVATQAVSQQQTLKLVVTIKASGEVFLDKAAIAIPSLSQQLMKAKRQSPNTVVVLNADGAVTHDRVVLVLDQIKKVPGLKMAIATKR